MILVVGQNLAWQRVCVLPRLEIGGVNRVEEVHAFASSKGPNVVRALASMGRKGLAMGYAGGKTGDLICDDLKREGLTADFTRIAAETRICTTLAERGGHSTEIIDPSPVVAEGEREEFRQTFRRHLSEADALFISGTAVKGESEDCYAYLVAQAHARGIPVLLDSASREARLAMREKPEILKVNLRELADILGRAVNEPKQRVTAYKELTETFGIRWFFTTLGPDGVEGFDGTGLLQAVPPAIHVINAIGSGDAASAGIGLVLTEERDAFSSSEAFRHALTTATAMGTANCLNPINGRVDRSDFESVFRQISVRHVTDW